MDKIAMIQRQTTYTTEEAREKLEEKNGNFVLVIEEFMGIQKPKEKPFSSVQQEIYKQIRTKMDHSIKQYNKNQEAKIHKDIATYLQKQE